MVETRKGNAMSFQAGQKVRGKVCGRFVVVKCEMSKSGFEIATVREVSPCGKFIDNKKMRFPADMLVAE